MNMSCVPFQQQEPFQQAVVWPYQQAAAQQLLMPPMQQSLQPPPLAPLMLQGSDYLTASTTLHQVNYLIIYF